MSLLLGFGKGLQQGAQMLNQGMYEDRQVRRAEELERMREASFERRWQRDVARQDQMRAEDKDEREANRIADTEYRISRDKQSQANADRQFGLAEQQAERQATEHEKAQVAKTFEVLDNQFAQKMKMLQARGQKDELTGQMIYDQATITAMNQLGKEHEVAQQRALQMLGDSGRLTGTPYEAAYRMSFGSDSNLAGEVDSEMRGNMAGAAGSATGGVKTRPQISLDGTNAATQVGAGQKPLISPGFLGGVQLGMGGFYNNQMAADRGAMSPAERVNTTVGQGVGLVGGLLKDVGELGVDGVVKGTDWLTRRPNTGR